MMARILAACGLLVLAIAGVSCNGSSTDIQWQDPATLSYYPGLHVNISRMAQTASGVFYWDSIAGTGTDPVHVGDQLTVKYSLWLPNGTLLDSNQSGFPVTLDTTQVIKGWVDGLQGAVQGTLRQLVVPPQLGYPYGNQNGTIPPNTSLVFLVSVDQVTTPTASLVSADDRKR